MEIRQRFRIALGMGRGGNTIGLECGHRCDPRRDCRREVLREEGTEWLIFPRLHIARGPVVQQAHAEEVAICIGNWDGRPEKVWLANVKRELEFVVERLR